ncbi:hypothetical protein FB451DRAFT_1460768 [Mycena latifolia]|nr:hypothetical protein FB451DRAFT_1460768 [Mycena latifolia]
MCARSVVCHGESPSNRREVIDVLAEIGDIGSKHISASSRLRTRVAELWNTINQQLRADFGLSKHERRKCPKLVRPRDFDKAHQARSRAWTRLARPFQGLSQPRNSSPGFPNPCPASQDRPRGLQKSSAAKSSFVASSTLTTTTHFNVDFTFLPYTSTLFWSQPTLLAGDAGAPRTKWAAGSAIDSAARRHKALLSFDMPSSPSYRSIKANCVRQLSTPARPRSAHAQRPTATDLRAVAGAGLLLVGCGDSEVAQRAPDFAGHVRSLWWKIAVISSQSTSPRPSFPSRNRRQAVSPFFLGAKLQTRARDSFGEGDAMEVPYGSHVAIGPFGHSASLAITIT